VGRWVGGIGLVLCICSFSVETFFCEMACRKMGTEGQKVHAWLVWIGSDDWMDGWNPKKKGIIDGTNSRCSVLAFGSLFLFLRFRLFFSLVEIRNRYPPPPFHSTLCLDWVVRFAVCFFFVLLLLLAG